MNHFSAGTVFRRQNLTSKDGPRAERDKTFIIAVDPLVQESYPLRHFNLEQIRNKLKFQESLLEVWQATYQKS